MVGNEVHGKGARVQSRGRLGEVATREQPVAYAYVCWSVWFFHFDGSKEWWNKSKFCFPFITYIFTFSLPLCRSLWLANLMASAYDMLPDAKGIALICLFSFVMSILRVSEGRTRLLAHTTLWHCTHIKSNLFDHLKTHLVMNF